MQEGGRLTGDFRADLQYADVAIRNASPADSRRVASGRNQACAGISAAVTFAAGGLHCRLPKRPSELMAGSHTD